ncbi:acyltransferase family protein [Chlorogloeopsis fritschii PCC 9212]|uniref:Acyltransferase 3 domain-containing protein n=1 Tax=Chlorogloeopsis fritschii PCC 6912 TaxID=211165 RepID=A0A3S0ZYL5_CHLFR|nr:acyltransferase [Chlorogloeopsis fritschii]RUR83327.1 hypothetical protein PCC6912_21600 [Chlorogloeopsis fritschii PCC 6912]
MGNQLLTPLPTLIHNHNRLDPLLTLRGFACFMVVIFHCLPPRNSIIYKGYDLSWLLCSNGMVAVWIFFVLSGYLMGKAFYTHRYTNDVPGVINFWRNRALRIFPLYYFAVLFLTVLVYPDWMRIENWGYLIRVCTFTYDGSPQLLSNLNFNGVFWSLSTEVQFYVIVPFIYSYFKHRLLNRKQVILSILLIFFTIFITRCIFWIAFRDEMSDKFSYVFKYWYAPLFTNLDLFLCGFLLNALLSNTKLDYEIGVNGREDNKSNNIFLNVSKKNIALILIFLLYLFTAHHFYHQELFNLPERLGKGFRTTTTIFILPLVTALVVSFFIFTFEYYEYNDFTKNEKLSFRIIIKNPVRVVEVFGHLSYGIYIWHVPIIEKVTPIFTSKIPIEAFYGRLIATFFLSTVLASVSYYLIELPYAKNKISRQNEN